MKMDSDDFNFDSYSQFDYVSSSSSRAGHFGATPSTDEHHSSPEDDQQTCTLTTTTVPSSSSSSSSSGDTSLVKARRKPMPRKGHTKSRRGCFNCKKRKIKCPETFPRCENCLKAGMSCEYPKRDLSPSEPTNTLPSPIMQPQGTPTLFTANDMKYFHCFITRAYPHLPVGADSLWTLDLPSQAHEVS
jgi:hypothetical protein